MPKKPSQSDPLTPPPPPKKKSKKVEVLMDPDLYGDLSHYTESNGVSVGALIRALLRRWVNREDPRPLPPGIESENRRPSRRKPKPPSE